MVDIGPNLMNVITTVLTGIGTLIAFSIVYAFIMDKPWWK